MQSRKNAPALDVGAGDSTDDFTKEVPYKVESINRLWFDIGLGRVGGVGGFCCGM